jgi:probable HAF family extracellular repeat protein
MDRAEAVIAMKTPFVILGVAIVVACAKDGPTGPVPVRSVFIAPTLSASLPVGDSLRVTATVRDAQGSALTDRAITWSTGDAPAATVRPIAASTDAMVTAVRSGTVILTATSEGKSGTLSFVVTEPVASLSVSLTDTAVSIGQRAVLIVFLRDANNGTVSRRPITYASSNVAVATVSTTGIVTGVAAGTAVIRAMCDGKSGEATVTIVPAPTQHAFLWTAANGIKDLSTLPGFTISVALAINASGQVVGSSSDAETANARTHAVIWSPAGVPQDLGTLPAGGNSSAAAINSLGQVVGSATVVAGPAGTPPHAVLWSPTGVIRDLGTLPGDISSFATGINDAGQVVGTSMSSGAARTRAFVWTEAGGMVDPLLAVTPTAATAGANAINRTGWIAGWSGVKAFRLSPAGVFQSFVVAAGDSSAQATAINDAGDAVGVSQAIYSDFYYYYYYSVPHAALWPATGGFVNLSALGGCVSVACEVYGLNNRGQVVGYSGSHAFIWTQLGGFTDLGVLPRRNSSVARGVNDAGQVVGYSR